MQKVKVMKFDKTKTEKIMILKKIGNSIVFLAGALVMYGAMKNTMPTGDDHMQHLTDEVERIVDKMMDHIKVPEESRQLADFLSTEVIPKGVDRLLNGDLDVTDFGGLVSVGKVIDDDGNERIASVGIFGHVFTVGSEELQQEVEQAVMEAYGADKGTECYEDPDEEPDDNSDEP